MRFQGLIRAHATRPPRSDANPKIISEVPGHATMIMILDTYSHVLPTMQGGAADALEDALR